MREARSCQLVQSLSIPPHIPNQRPLNSGDHGRQGHGRIFQSLWITAPAAFEFWLFSLR